MSVALITGATSGIGKAFAYRLAQSHKNLVLVARNSELLAQLGQDLQIEYGVDVEIIVADLATRDGIDTVCTRVDSTDNPVVMLINNAGFALGDNFVDSALSQESEGLVVMVQAVMELSHHAAQAMKKRGSGAIINLSSLASRMIAGTYCAHKAWVLNFSQSLAYELAPFGVQVTCVAPGPVRTQFFTKIGVSEAQLYPSWLLRDAEDIVQAALDGVARRKTVVPVGFPANLAFGLMKFAPAALVQRVAYAGPHF